MLIIRKQLHLFHMKKTKIIYKVFNEKTISWFENKNEYIVLENTTATILKKINNGIPINEIAAVLSRELNVPLEKSIDFVSELEKEFFKEDNSEKIKILNNENTVIKPKKFEFIEHYKINDLIFKVSFLSDNELSLVHPKFAHLVIDKETKFHNEFEVFINHNRIFLYVDNQLIGSWDSNDIHYFQGKFSMELIQKIHQKEENDWLGVFHASAISNGEKSMLFLGDSGNGKSTSLAILQANRLEQAL